MTKLIETPGTYQVVIRDPHWEDATKDGDPGMALVLPGFCEIDGEEYTITGRLYFKSTIIGSGKNQGKPLYELSMETCFAIGMSTPFSPDKRHELDGKEARFVVQEEEYKGKTQIRVAFVNPPGKESIEDAKAKEIWGQITGNSGGQSQQSTPFDTKDEDQEIPF